MRVTPCAFWSETTQKEHVAKSDIKVFGERQCELFKRASELSPPWTSPKVPIVALSASTG